MKERPILFSGAMVRAILAGQKTQTRRVLRIQPTNYLPEWPPHYDRASGGAMWGSIRGDHGIDCPYGVPGDQLWVRETWGIDNCGARVSLAPEAWPGGWPTSRLRYNADGEITFGKRPAIHMPRWACRLRLDVIGVRVERLQYISERDAKEEGVTLPTSGSHRGGYAILWDSINGKRGLVTWTHNPWVWVVEFKRAT